MNAMIIRADGLEKHFGKKHVLNGVSFDLPSGGIHGLLGRNGVGKSTLLQIVAGQLKSSGGAVEVFGLAPFDNAEVMDRVALTGVDVTYPASWSGKDILKGAQLRYPNWDDGLARRLIDDFDLDEALGTTYSKMSRGQRAMVGNIVGIASGAELTLLDEPYVGLDVHNTNVFYRHLLDVAEDGRTFVMATHHIEEASKILSSALVLGRDGKVSAHVTADDADAHAERLDLSNPLRPVDFGDVIEHLLEVS